MEFSREELLAVLTLGVTSGIIVTFSDFIKLTSDGRLIIETTGLIILFLGIFGMIISVFIHEGSHKFFAERIGYRTNIETYYPGQVIGVVLAVFSFGYITFFTPNTTDLEANPLARVHKHRKYENFRQQAFISIFGIFMTGILATILHGAWILTSSPLLKDLMMGNIWLMVYSLVPFELLSLLLLRFQQKVDQLPQSDGIYIFHYSITVSFAIAVFAIILAIILRFTTSVPVWAAFMIAGIAWVWAWYNFSIKA